MFSLPTAQVQYLVGELRSHKPHGRAKTRQNKETSCARVVIVSYSHRYILHSIYPNSRFPGRKHVLAQTTLDKHLSHSKQLYLTRVEGTLLKSKFPDASQGPTLQAGLSKDRSLVCCYSFAHLVTIPRE